MNRLQRVSVLLALLNELAQRGCWNGETHLQKTAFFLQKLLRVPLDFDFILYKHGPFSFDLSDEITAMRADQLLLVQPREGYGPSLLPSEGGARIMARFPVTQAKYAKQIQFVATHLARKNVAELEKLATALYVTASGERDSDKRATEINRLKPHVSMEDAREALRFVDQMRANAELLGQE